LQIRYCNQVIRRRPIADQRLSNIAVGVSRLAGTRCGKDIRLQIGKVGSDVDRHVVSQQRGPANSSRGEARIGLSAAGRGEVEDHSAVSKSDRNLQKRAESERRKANTHSVSFVKSGRMGNPPPPSRVSQAWQA